MKQHNFSEIDKQNFIDFLNMVSKKAEFKFNTKEALKYCKLLAQMQQSLLPKINTHILEIKKVIEPTLEGDREAEQKS